VKELLGIVLIPLLAVIAPLVSRAISRWAIIPVVVFEILLGIIVGPDVLGWADRNDFLAILAELGLALLFFVAGTEIEFRAIAGRPVRRSIVAWLISFVLATALGLLIAGGQIEAAIIVGVALSSTALGAILPILRDAGLSGTPVGTAVSAIGAVGEFGPLIAISVFLGARSIGVNSLILAAFIIVTGVLILVALRMPHGRLHRLVRETLHTTSQFAVRVILLIVAALVVLSALLGLDILLGAFAAGVLWQIMLRHAPEEDVAHVKSKIDGVAFGFLVPIFFISTGVNFQLSALLAEPMLLALVPVIALALIAIRGLPAQLVAPPGTSRGDRMRISLYAATGLPIIVAATSIGTELGVLSTGNAALLVSAGMLSVLLFPYLASIGRRSTAVGAVFEPVDQDD